VINPPIYIMRMYVFGVKTGFLILDFQNRALKFQGDIRDFQNRVLKVQCGIRDFRNIVLKVQGGIRDFPNRALMVQGGIRDFRNRTLKVQGGIRDFPNRALKVQGGILNIRKEKTPKFDRFCTKYIFINNNSPILGKKFKIPMFSLEQGDSKC